MKVGIRGRRAQLGRAIVDTGAAFTLISRQAALEHGLDIVPEAASYVVANGDDARLCGMTSFHMQVHDGLELVLRGVRV